MRYLHIKNLFISKWFVYVIVSSQINEHLIEEQKIKYI